MSAFRSRRCKQLLCGASACLVLALAGTHAQAQTVNIPARHDNTLYQSPGGALSNGAGSHMFAGRTGQDADYRRRALVEFEVAGVIPAGSSVTGVTLHLYMSRTSSATARTVSVHRVLAAWGEGTSNDVAQEGGGVAATTGDATWLHRFFATQFWSSAGGDYAAAPSAANGIGAIGPYTWSGAGLVADVQAWLDAPGTNFGWVLIGDESTPGTAKRFDTREENVSAQRPRLTVTFAPPAQSGACCAAEGECSIATAAACGLGGGTYQGDGSVCVPNTCPQPQGACCATDGSCSLATALACGSAGGSFRGGGTSCTPNQCPQPTGACCVPGQPGSCSVASAASCTAQLGTFQGVGSQCQVDLCPYVDALPRPAVAVPTIGQAGAAATYHVAVQQIAQKLHRDLPPTTLWGYAGSYPGPTIEAAANQPVTIEWMNDLRDGAGALRTSHLLPVDTCLEGPDTEGPTPRVVAHLHGGHTPWSSDGFPEDTVLPGASRTYLYPNRQLPATLWYHDHAMGITRLNVYLGMAGFYLVRDEAEAALGLPTGEYEIALALQDRAIGADGALVYPAAWQEHFFGDKILVNGKVWPYLAVDRGWYRFRVLNGSNARTLTLSLSNGASLHVIGNDGGLLPAPVPASALTLGPGERADVALDFGGYPPGTQILLQNSAPAPYPGVPGIGVVARVMRFVVGADSGHATPLPATLIALERLDPAAATLERTLELRKVADACTGSAWTIDGRGWQDPITELPVLGTTEIWRFVNRSGMAHPMHLHLSMFQIVDRQPFTLVGGNVVPSGPALPPAPEESGWKDTVLVDAFEIVRVVVPFEDYAGFYPYHCHVLEHEDNEMMRMFQTRPAAIFQNGFE